MSAIEMLLEENNANGYKAVAKDPEIPVVTARKIIGKNSLTVKLL